MTHRYPLDEPLPDYEDADQYDTDNTWGADDDFYLELAREIGGPVLDIGCGTGRLTRAFAAAGLETVGVDVTPAMLDRARRLSDGLHIDWLVADARTMQLGHRFRLITMTGHGFQHLLTDEDVNAFFDRAREHLEDGGHLVFDTRNYAAKTFGTSEKPTFWRSTVDAQGRDIDILVGGRLDPRTWVEELTFVDVVRETGERSESGSILRYLPLERLNTMLREHGFEIVAQYGDWQRGPLAADKPEIVSVCRLAVAG